MRKKVKPEVKAKVLTKVKPESKVKPKSKVKETKESPETTEETKKEKEAELWESLPFTEGRYEISSHGRVRSFLQNEDGKLLTPCEVNGYPVVSLMIDGKPRQYYIHKLVADVFVTRIEGEIIVHHKDWDKTNNYHKNINWLTPESSSKKRDRRRKELTKGENKPGSNSKLKIEDIIRLKRLLKMGIKQNVIAKLFAISEMQVTRIKRNENWAHVEVPDDLD